VSARRLPRVSRITAFRTALPVHLKASQQWGALLSGFDCTSVERRADASDRAGRLLLGFAKEYRRATLPPENLLDLPVDGGSPDPQRLCSGCPASANKQCMIDGSGLDLGHRQEMAIGAD
jgi:hypothetical protein